MQEVEVIINDPKEGVFTCTTVNPFGRSKPTKLLFTDLLDDNQVRLVLHNVSKKWQQAESERKTYAIEYKCCLGTNPHIDTCGLCADWRMCQPGTTHKVIINNGKATIL